MGMLRKAKSGLGAAVLAAAMCSSCFTAALWTADVHGPHHGVPQRLALLPFTLFLDLVTLPVQLVVWYPDPNCHP